MYIQLYIYVCREARERDRERERDRMIERESAWQRERMRQRLKEREERERNEKVCYCMHLNQIWPPCLTSFWPWNLARAAAALYPLKARSPPGPFLWPLDSQAPLCLSAGDVPQFVTFCGNLIRKTYKYTFMTFFWLGSFGEISLFAQD